MSRRHFWRHLCVTLGRRSFESCGEFVDVDFVGVRLSCVWPGVPHERLESDEITVTLDGEPIGEAMAKLVG